MLFFDLLALDYPWALVAGMVLNFQIAALSLILGLGIGGALVCALVAGRSTGMLAKPVISLMRAAPTFVVMFFLLNIIPSDFAIAGVGLAPSAEVIVALSLVPYAVSYVADNGVDAIIKYRNGSIEAALLFVPSTMRAFFVLVMSSGAGAAIGVHDGVAVVLQTADHYASLGDKMAVFAVGVIAFGVVFQIGFWGAKLMVLLVRKYSATR